MSRRAIQAYINKPSGISSFKIWIFLTAKSLLAVFFKLAFIYGLLWQNIFFLHWTVLNSQLNTKLKEIVLVEERHLLAF